MNIPLSFSSRQSSNRTPRRVNSSVWKRTDCHGGERKCRSKPRLALRKTRSSPSRRTNRFCDSSGGDYFKPGLALTVQPAAFEPHKNDTDGISVFRLACLTDPGEALAVIANEKREKYAIASLSIAELTSLGLTVQPDKIAKVPGHAVVSEMNILSCKADKARCKTLQKQLAELASRNIVHRPAK